MCPATAGSGQGSATHTHRPVFLLLWSCPASCPALHAPPPPSSPLPLRPSAPAALVANNAGSHAQHCINKKYVTLIRLCRQQYSPMSTRQQNHDRPTFVKTQGLDTRAASR